MGGVIYVEGNGEKWEANAIHTYTELMAGSETEGVKQER